MSIRQQTPVVYSSTCRIRIVTWQACKRQHVTAAEILRNTCQPMRTSTAFHRANPPAIPHARRGYGSTRPTRCRAGRCTPDCRQLGRIDSDRCNLATCTILHNMLRTGWHGLGRTLDARGDVAGWECGVDDRTALDLLEAACNVATANQAGAMRTMVERTGATVADARRLKARTGRANAARVGIALPPWWRLRLAARRTAAYQTAQYGPGSTPADPT